MTALTSPAVDGKSPLLKMFSEVPPSYDLINRILTLRLDERWRNKAALECLREQPSRVLDLCTGTADLAIRLSRLANPQTQIDALDFSRSMLELAERKATQKQGNTITFFYADVASMPFPDQTYDVVAIAFAFRNLTYNNPRRDEYLKEIRRILIPGGKLVIVETCQPKKRWLKKLFHFYMKNIATALGSYISGHRGAYHYLSQSVIHYWNDKQVGDFLSDHGFSSINTALLAGGIAALYTARK